MSKICVRISVETLHNDFILVRKEVIRKNELELDVR